MSKFNSTKNVLFLMSGSISAYKSCHILSRLNQRGFQIKVVATPETLQFVGNATIEGLTGHRLLTDTFEAGQSMDHIHLARWADMIVLCPATANTLNKMANGIGDNLVTNLFLAHDFKKPFIVAPAMNSAMYAHPITQKSLSILESLGLKILPTESGNLACGESGPGRLLEPEIILQTIEREFVSLSSTSTRKKILITSGGTQEPIDSMRVLTNLSSGQTGAFLAEKLHDSGFEVVYLGAQTAIKPQRLCETHTFSSFDDLNQKLKELLLSNNIDGVIHAAAVSDFRVKSIRNRDGETIETSGKLSSGHGLSIDLVPNFKILPLLKSYSCNQDIKVVGFKFTATKDLGQRQTAIEKLFHDGGVDLVVHNDQSEINKAQGLHSFTLCSRSKYQSIENKNQLADELVNFFKFIDSNSNTMEVFL